MSEVELIHMHEDLEIMNRDIAIIKHILTQEGELTEETKIRLDRSRSIPRSEFIEL